MMPQKNNIQEYGESQEPEDSFCKDTRNRNLSFPFVFKCFPLVGNYEVTSYESWGNYQEPKHGFYSILEEVTQISNYFRNGYHLGLRVN